MNLSANTKFSELLEAHPDIKEKITASIPQLSVLTTPVAQALLKNATLADLAQKAGISPDDLVSKIQGLLK